MFFGQCTAQIDHDKVLTFPAHFAEALSGNVYVTQGFDRNLVIMPEHVFIALYQRVTRFNMADPLARQLLRMILGSATFVHLHGERAIPLAGRLYDYAGLTEDDETVLVGQGDHVEVWSRSHWEQQRDDLQNASLNSERFAALDLRI